MRIVICDDDLRDLNEVRSLVFKICRKHRITADIDSCSTGEACKAALETQKTDILLLDVFLGDDLGIDIAKWLRTFDKSCAIIFITTSREFAVEGFSVNACHYLIKPITEANLLQGLQRASNQFNPQGYFSVIHDYNETKVKYNSILYIEANRKQAILYTNDGSSITCYSSLDALEEQLWKHHIVRCHRSYMVNLGNTASIDKNTIHLVNGRDIPLSRTKSKELNSLYSDYLFNTLRES